LFVKKTAFTLATRPHSQLLNPTREFIRCSFPYSRNCTSLESLTAKNVDVPTEVGRQVKIPVLQDGDFLLAELTVKVAKFEHHIQIGDLVFGLSYGGG
jgi:hypothetical protein